jgi:hypothetical protein
LDGPPPVARYEGEVAIRGRVPADGGQVTVDGRSLPPGADLSALGPVQSLEIEFSPVTAASIERQRITAMRITTGR